MIKVDATVKNAIEKRTTEQVYGILNVLLFQSIEREFNLPDFLISRLTELSEGLYSWL